MRRPERKDLSLGERVAFALGGIFAALDGYGQLLRGKPIYSNWCGFDISAQFVVFLGGMFLLVAVFPWSRIHFLWETARKKRLR